MLYVDSQNRCHLSQTLTMSGSSAKFLENIHLSFDLSYRFLVNHIDQIADLRLRRKKYFKSKL